MSSGAQGGGRHGAAVAQGGVWAQPPPCANAPSTTRTLRRTSTKQASPPPVLRQMGGAPRNPALRNHFFVRTVKPSGCHCADAFRGKKCRRVPTPPRDTSPFSDVRGASACDELWTPVCEKAGTRAWKAANTRAQGFLEAWSRFAPRRAAAEVRLRLLRRLLLLLLLLLLVIVIIILLIIVIIINMIIPNNTAYAERRGAHRDKLLPCSDSFWNRVGSTCT